MKPVPRAGKWTDRWPSAKSFAAAGILVVAALLRFWRLGDVALIGDESYYWLWSERLAPCYYDNPAGVALLVRTSTWAGGQGEVGVRWLNALLGAGAVFLAYQAGARLLSGQSALLAASLLAVGAPYLVISRFVYTDALQLCLLLLNVYILAPFLPAEGRTGRADIPTWRFWAAALSTAALLNTKYNAYLYAATMAAFLALRRPALLRDRRTWWAAGVALLGLLPALAWNAAHGWASYRWQFTHLTQATLHSSPPGLWSAGLWSAGLWSAGLWSALGRAWHAVRYLTPPLALVALAGAVPTRSARRQMLYVAALAFVLPIVLSPTDSPRNLVNGVALLLLLGCDALWRGAALIGQRVPILSARSARPVMAHAFALILILWAGQVGLGTVLETLHPTPWPHSPVATTIRQESLGWRDAPHLDLDPQAFLFAVDYNIAAQLRYYTGLPVQTGWGQYRIWGIPELEGPAGAEQTTLILALSYVEPDLVSERLQAAFAEATGPTPMPLREGGEVRYLNVWRARGRQVDAETFLETFDPLNLAQVSQAAGQQQEARP